MTETAFALPAAVRETLQIFWESPFPATLQDEHFRFVDVNDAYLEFSGFAREALTPCQVRPRCRAGVAAIATTGSRGRRQAWRELLKPPVAPMAVP